MIHQELYHNIECSVRSLSVNVKLNQSYTLNEIRAAIRCVMRDNPDIFWFDHQYHYDEANSTIHFQYTFSAERVRIIQQSINDVIDNDFRVDYVKTLTQQEKIVYVYKWLVSYCNYNINSAYNQSIYSVFVCRNSVCTGYAKAAQYLFCLLGIESRLVFGRLRGDYGRHCWNIVKVDNQYYHFDVCFGDSILDGVALESGVRDLFKIDGINFTFLCVSADEILGTRSIEDILTLPKCPVSWPRDLIVSLSGLEIKQREGIKGCLLSHIGSSSDIYLCTQDKNTVLKVFRHDSKAKSLEEFKFMQQTKGCLHILQYNEQFTDLSQNIIAIEQSTPIVNLLCSHYYELSLKGLIKMATNIAEAWKECQERGVLYRDIHVCNIYRANDGTFKLGDLGSCTNDFAIKEVVGNQWFMSPETFVSGIFTEASAVYSISMVMYFILNNLRPAFWRSGCEDESLHKRMDGHQLPIPVGCLNFPPHIKSEFINFFKRVSASFPEKRIGSIKEFIHELERLTYSCKDRDYTIYHKYIGLDFNLDTGNNGRLDDCWNYINDDNHKYEKKCDIEQICRTVVYFSHDIVSDNEIMTVDTVEHFAMTRGGFSTYEPVPAVCPCDLSSVKTKINNLEIEYKDIDRRLAKINQLKSELSEIESETKAFSMRPARSSSPAPDLLPSPSRAPAPPASVGLITRIIRGIASLFSKPVPQSEDRHLEISPEYDDELKAKMSRARKYETMIKNFMRRKNEIEKELAVLEEQNKFDNVCSSIFAPAEVNRKSHMLVQVYLHLYDEVNIVRSQAKEADKNAERRDYMPLSLKLKRNDKVDVEFNVYGETRLMSDRKSIIWQGSLTKCTFDYFVPKDIDVNELSCEANLFVNGAMIGEMRFLTQIVEAPRSLNPEILSHRFNKIFISYAHQDAHQIKLLALAYKAQGVDYFYDRDSLAPGDVYEEKIFDYIDSSDLFVLCWSQNAAVSDYVSKEKGRALLRAYPHLSRKEATLRICPISIEPRADLPGDMKDIYNFEVI